MILVTAEGRCSHHINPGDTLKLSIEDEVLKRKDTLTEVITRPMSIDTFGSFRFVEDDGSLLHPCLCGFFGEQRTLPPELLTAKRLDDLEPQQLENYKKSAITSPQVSKTVTQLPSGLYVVDFFTKFKRWLGL